MNLFNFFTPKAETYYVEPDSTIRQALEKFDRYKFTVLPMVDEEGIYISTISEGDILRYIKNTAGFDLAVAESVRISEIERYRSYLPCTADISMDDLIQLAMKQNFIPIVDDRGAYIGIVKRKAVLNMLYHTDTDKDD